MNDTISVIVPIYNVEKYLNDCIKSIVNQSYTSLEIILIDDGSLDSSGNIAEDWLLKDNRIKVVHKKNGGLSDARNVGISCATGNYLMFVDSDDVISENICDRLFTTLKNNQAQIAICDANHIFNGTINWCNNFEQAIILNKDQAIIEMWYQKSFLPSAWGKLYKKELFNNIRFKKGIIFEDIDIMHELFYQANRIIYIPEQLYGYRHRSDSITTTQFSKKDLIILEICNKIYNFSLDKGENYVSAAKAYYIVGALRVYLNCPKIYKHEINQAKQIINQYGKDVLKDTKIRNKTKYSLILYFYMKPLLKPIYRRINRWK